MTWEWKIGDPVDDANGGFMDAQNWTGDHYVVEKKRDESSSNNSGNNYHPEYNQYLHEKRKREEKRKEQVKRTKELEEEKKRKKEQEKRLKELEEEKKRKKEECERNPECVKKHLAHFKKKVLKDYFLFSRFEIYQAKSDIKFRQILEYEELLEKLEGKKNYTKQDFDVLKKENQRVQYILSHMNGEYRINAIKLYLKNQKTISELETRYPQKGFFKALINEVFKSDPGPIESLEIELSAREKLKKARTLTSTKLYETANMQEAMDLLNQARTELSSYLKYKKANDILRNLNNEIGDLEAEINNKLFKLLNFTNKRLFLINRDKYSTNQFKGKPGMDLTLVKEDDEDIITVYYDNEPIGIVSNTFTSDFEKIFSDTSQLEYLPKTSSAKYFYRYGKFDIFEINVSRIKIDERLKQEKILKKYPKDELITIVGLKDMEFSEGMKFKLIKDAGEIGVYLDDEKIGLVSNSYLNLNLTTKASNLKDIPDESYAEYLLKYENKYPIAHIIKNLNSTEEHNIDGSTINSSLDDDILKKEIAYVKKSKYRAKVVRSLDGAVKTPTQIAEDTRIARNSIYNTLKQLNEHKIIECTNPEVKRGKLYKLTDKGENIIKNLDW